MYNCIKRRVILFFEFLCNLVAIFFALKHFFKSVVSHYTATIYGCEFKKMFLNFWFADITASSLSCICGISFFAVFSSSLIFSLCYWYGSSYVNHQQLDCPKRFIQLGASRNYNIYRSHR